MHKMNLDQVEFKYLVVMMMIVVSFVGREGA